MKDMERQPPVGAIARLAQLQAEVNIEMSALTPEQRAKRAKESLRYMPGQAYLFRDEALMPRSALRDP